MLISAGILPFRRNKEMQVLLVHAGTPFWAKKDERSWSIPKGLAADDEEPVMAAKREFYEETGFIPSRKLFSFLPVKQKSGKTILAWAADPATIISNSFEMESPPGSGKKQLYPEVDRAGWFKMAEARRKILIGQLLLLMYPEQLILEK